VAAIAKKDVQKFKEIIGKTKRYTLTNDFFAKEHKTVLFSEIREDVGYSFLALKDLRDMFSLKEMFILDIPYPHEDIKTDRPIALISSRDLSEFAIILAPFTDINNLHKPLDMEGFTYEMLQDQSPMSRWA
jgi:hypothetical protein